MSDSRTEVKVEKMTQLSRLSVILAAVAGGMLFVLLVFLGVTANFEIYQSRTYNGLSVIEDFTCREVESTEAPIEVVKEYTFTIPGDIETDTNLAFYTVHQYVEIYIDGQLVYSLKPSGKLFTRTIGCNWAMVPLYREDVNQEIRVNILPVYESVRNREVEFWVGSRFTLFRKRFYQDLPQLLLSIMVIFVGIVFSGISVYKLIRRHTDDGFAALGLFSVMMGLWRLTDTRFTPFLVPEKPVLMFYISITILMIGMVPLIKFLEVRFHKARRRMLDLYCIAAAGVCMVQVLLQVFGGGDIRDNFYIIHLVIAVGSVILVGNVIYERVKYPQNQKDNVRSKAAFIFVIGVLADMVVFYVRGTSSGLVFSLLAMLIYVMLTGVHMVFHYIEQEKQLAEMERKLAESRIATMISQIRPHFIYNTLGSIEQLCELQPEAAAKLVHNFSRYLRGNFSELDNPAPIRLSKEMEHVQYYVAIEQIRFPDIEFHFDMRSDDFLLPAMSVQPLVENAIKHGLMQLPKGGAVTVSSYETNTHYCVSVEDNGAGFDVSILRGDRKYIGLRNIRGRLEVMCSGTLTVESTPGVGTKVLISIPKGV